MEINDRLKEYSEDTAAILVVHMENTSKKYGIKLSIEDVFGICSRSPGLKNALDSYLIHNNKFCNFVKQDKSCLWKCSYNKAATIEKCKKLQAPFFGTCYMGISEYVFPVIINKRLVSVIYAGQFCHSSYNSIKLSESIGKYKLPKKEIHAAYNKAVTETVFSDGLISDINLIKKLICLLIYEERPKTPHHNNTIIDNAVSFINENYEEELSLSLIASSCYCNPSYLSYLMKKTHGVTVTDYVNMIRINKAKELIGISNLSLTGIAYKVGFNDLAYFSRVFKKINGMSPNEYRKT